MIAGARNNDQREKRASLLELSAERRALEARRAQEIEATSRLDRQETRRVFWQCILLALAGVPIYAWSWHLTDPQSVRLAVTVGFFVTYGLPFFRWLAFHVRRSEAFD